MKRIVLVALLATACSTPDTDLLPPTPRDAGTPDARVADAGRPVDAGSIVDAGAPVDAGSTLDAGTHDAGDVADAGPSDAGSSDGGVVCATLQRDVCIATPGCVLGGSETIDPGYFCRDALSPCEAIADATACESEPGCVAYPGSCYCPEGQDCVCGGGPAPVCREFCGGFAGTPCPNSNFFCDLPQMPSSSGPVCTGNSDQLGLCIPIPTSCRGTPIGAVCGCDQNFDPTDFTNDCERRLASAHQARSGACP